MNSIPEPLTYVPLDVSYHLHTPVVSPVPLQRLNDWVLSPSLSIKHVKGSFYSTVGVYSSSLNSASILFDQNEIGVLLTYIRLDQDNPSNPIFLLNLKFEPGNKPLYQLSPSIQKTYSNLAGLHGGKATAITSIIGKHGRTIYTTLLTEQSNSFLHKKNLNCVATIDSDNALNELAAEYNLIAFDLKQLITLSLSNSCLHIDLRSSLCQYLFALLPYAQRNSKPQLSSIYYKLSLFSFLNQNTWQFASISSFASFENGIISVRDVSGQCSQKLLGFSVTSGNREVNSWSQPLLWYPQSVFDLIYSIDNDFNLTIVCGISSGPGSRNETELAPTCVDGSASLSIKKILSKSSLVHTSEQTEEGGRFFQRSNLHNLYRYDSGHLELDELSDAAIAVSAPDLLNLLATGQLVSIELRSCLFLLSSYLINEL